MNRNTHSPAWKHGFNSVASRPVYAPSNPYDDEKNFTDWEDWEEGADEAGINSMYMNGILIK